MSDAILKNVDERKCLRTRIDCTTWKAIAFLFELYVNIFHELSEKIQPLCGCIQPGTSGFWGCREARGEGHRILHHHRYVGERR